MLVLLLRVVLSLSFVIALPLWGQIPATKTENPTIQRVRTTSVRSLEPGLPNVSLEFFLKSEGQGAPVAWEVNDCGEQAGNPEVDHGRDTPMCVAAEMDLKDRRVVSVLVSVGTQKKGSFGAPSLHSVTLIEASGLVRPLKHLSDLPMALNRPKRRPY